MKLIAFDASTEVVSVARHDTDHPGDDDFYHQYAPREHARQLIPAARDLLAEADWTWATLDAIAFGRGPGAFTGIRIAAGLVQGLAYGLGVPVIAVDTLRAIAARVLAASDSDKAQIVQDARMGEIYTGRYVRDAQRIVIRRAPPSVSDPAALAIERGNGWAYAGNGWPLVAAAQGVVAPPVVVDGPHALDVAHLGARDLAAGLATDAGGALPEYVRDDVARKPAGH